jgi:hypothetical protein
MARTPSHQDAIVNDLQAIRRCLSWTRPEQFEGLDTLLGHPLVTERAAPSNETPALVEALKATLEEVVQKIAEEEQLTELEMGRSVAYASTVLLRLEPEYERKSIKELREDITARWEKRGGGKLGVDTFRQQLEVSEVYEPFAKAFRRLAAEQRSRRSAETERAVAPESSRSAQALERALGIVKRELPEPSEISNALLDLEVETLKERVANLREGRLVVRDEDEMFNILIKLTELANEDCRAIDSVPAGEWFSSLKLNHYLERQLERVETEGIELERIRIIDDDELQGGRSWEQLHELIERHEKADARFLLCRRDVIPELRLRFNTHMGLFMVDAGTKSPAAVTGELSEGGSIGLARVFLGHTEMIREFEREYEDLKRVAVDQNREIREMLPIGI